MDTTSGNPSTPNASSQGTSPRGTSAQSGSSQSSASTDAHFDSSTPTAQIDHALSTADAMAQDSVQNLANVHRARLARAQRNVSALTAQYGASDARVTRAQAMVTAATNTISRVSAAALQMKAPAVQVAKNAWAMQGWVRDAQLQPAARFTVFLVDANKTFLKQFGFAYTDDTGYYLLNYAGDASPAAAMFIEVANAAGNPVYLAATAFQPIVGGVSSQNIVLPAGAQPIGDPPAVIRGEALPPADVNKSS